MSRQKLLWQIIRCEPAEAALARDVEPVGAARLSLLSLRTELITPQRVGIQIRLAIAPFPVSLLPERLQHLHRPLVRVPGLKLPLDKGPQPLAEQLQRG